MNVRMIGCGAAAAAAFVLIGVIAILRTGAPAECPGLLPYEPATYEAVGTPMPEPVIAGVDGELEAAGEVSFGLAKWTAYVPPGMVPAGSDGILPPRIVLDCRDGTFQEFQRGTG